MLPYGFLVCTLFSHRATVQVKFMAVASIRNTVKIKN